MKKIEFKNPKGGTIYLAKVGFDWGAFWGIFLYGLPFFLRKMNMLGGFCLGFVLMIVLGMGFSAIDSGDSDFEKTYIHISNILIMFLFSLYFGIRGGKLTARHYVEEGYKCVTKDDALLVRAKAKWDMEV